MDPLYSESRPVLPRNLTYLVAVVLIATAAFMTISPSMFGTEMPSWSIPVTWILFVIVIALLLVLRMDVSIDSETVRIVYCFRTVTVSMGEIIDSRFGDLTEIRNYGQWNLRGVKHRSYVRIGDDDGVAMKVRGKRVIVFSTADAEVVCAMLPKDAPKEDVSEKEAQ